jgi:hypothetical protein
MDEQTNEPPDKPKLASIEGGLFDALFGFHQKVMALLREADLDDDKLDIAAERIGTLMSIVTDEMKCTRDLNIQPRLDSMCEEVQRLVDELSQSQGGRVEITDLQQIPNVGPSIAASLRRIGVSSPQDLLGKDAYTMYDELCRTSGVRQDPCVIDVFIAAVRFMAGEPAKPWWKYTPERKRTLAATAKRKA